MRAVYILEKLSDVSGPNLEEAGRYSKKAKKRNKREEEGGAPVRGEEAKERRKKA